MFPRSYSLKDIPQVQGKTAIVTGSNTGIGLVTARELVRKGWHVVLACRNENKAKEAMRSIETITGRSSSVDFLPLDLASLQSVRDFSKRFLEKYSSLNLLINNAGVLATKFELTKDGHEIHFGVNHLGHFLLTNLLLSRLRESHPSRIVVVSSVAHQHTFREGILFDDKKRNAPWKNIVERLHAYGQSKLANLLFAKELARRLEKTQVYVNALHPGVIRSELFRSENPFLLFPIMAFARTTENGALTSLYVATSPDIEEKNIRGAYFKPSATLPAPFIRPAICTPSSKARDAKLATSLWELSERLVGLSK
ncbi:protochlorophyllide reductase [Galdieria sulphuraria]|uniref:Protochlorophyllide reductase n=1 Tax=Galdieria sulphuraria TaxID=130081 RepID=M2WTZ4_GALSU|nr:protochlorophyllide reductase [Galdieria sulphuraria]EME27370.1 protochlorophyllide reductase [Galdieria sulphuraria]|eukprot:XP_005703890.1 protochlorophyllide reductase [Galdieria sulphuraria]